jgi:hypothetical protein
MAVLNNSTPAREARARRAARCAGLIARKSRLNSIDNFGGFMLVDPSTDFAVTGSGFNLSAEDVIEFCRAEAA